MGSQISLRQKQILLLTHCRTKVRLTHSPPSTQPNDTPLNKGQSAPLSQEGRNDIQQAAQGGKTQRLSDIAGSLTATVMYMKPP